MTRDPSHRTAEGFGRVGLLVVLVLAIAVASFLLSERQSSSETLHRTAGDAASGTDEEAVELERADSADSVAEAELDLVALDETTEREALSDQEASDTENVSLAVAGRVLDATGHPAAGAEVWLRSGGWYSTLPMEFGPVEAPDGQVLAVCDDDGRFKATDGLSPGGSLSIAVTFPGHAVERRLRVPFPRAPRDLGDVQLRPGRHLRGTVLTESGRPLEGAAVLLAARRGFMGVEGSFEGIGREVTRTDAAGRFEVDCLTPGAWHLYFDAEGFQVEERSGTFGGSSLQTLEPVRLAVGHSMAGEVIGWPEESGVLRWVEAVGSGNAGARPRRSAVDAKGGFQIHGIAPSERVTVRLVKAMEGGGFEPSTEAPPQWVPSNTKDVRIQFGKKLALEARVVDGAGVPVEHYQAFSQLGYFGGTHEIGGEGPSESLVHHPGGELRASGLKLFSREAEPRLHIHADGFFDFDSGGLKLEPGTTLRLDPVTLERAPMLRVTALSPAGTPAAGAEIKWSFKDGRERSAVTNAEGFAALTASANEPSILTISAGHFSIQQREMPPLEGRDRSVTFELTQGCALRVQLLAPPLPSVAATLRGHRIDALQLLSSGVPDSSTATSATTDENGLAHWQGLKPGSYRVRRVPPAREPQPATPDWMRCPEVRLTPNVPPPTVTLVAPATGSLAGVVMVEGQPLPVATLRLSPNDERGGATGDRDGWRSQYNRLTDAQGHFRYDGIAVGEYTMEVEHDDHAMIARWPVKVTDGVTSVEVQLQLAPIVVAVVREDGSPIAGANVRLVPDAPRYVGHNDGRRAWLDERGEVKQAWYQKELGHRATDTGGIATFPGCVPGLEGLFTVEPIEGLFAARTRFRVDPSGSDYRIIMAPPAESEAEVDAPK